MDDVLRDQNRDQYEKIHSLTDRVAKLDSCVEGLKVDLIGVTGHNGLRGEFRTYREGSEKREESILSMMTELKGELKEMDKKRSDAKKYQTTLILAGPAFAVAIITLIGRLI